MPSIVPGEPCRARTRKPWSCFFIRYKYRPFWPRIASATNETVSCTASCTQNMSELSFDVSIRQSPWHVNMNALLLQLPFYQSITLHNGANNFYRESSTFNGGLHFWPTFWHLLELTATLIRYQTPSFLLSHTLPTYYDQISTPVYQTWLWSWVNKLQFWYPIMLMKLYKMYEFVIVYVFILYSMYVYVCICMHMDVYVYYNGAYSY